MIPSDIKQKLVKMFVDVGLSALVVDTRSSEKKVRVTWIQK